MSSDVTVTLAGFVGTTPKLFTSQSGNDYTSFRVAHTKRYLDRVRGEWVDGRTTWFTVKAWRGVARNVATSLRKGDAVVVTGRLSVDEWTGPEGPRTNLVVEATALGPDLTRGEARFRHTVHRRDGSPEEPVGGPGAGASDVGLSGGGRSETGSDGRGMVAVPGHGDEDPWQIGGVDGEDGDGSGDSEGSGADGADAGDGAADFAANRADRIDAVDAADRMDGLAREPELVGA